MKCVLGDPAGHHFHGNADLEVVVHVRIGNRISGYLHTRKKLVDREAFKYDPRLGWRYDRWFTWPKLEDDQ